MKLKHLFLTAILLSIATFAVVSINRKPDAKPQTDPHIGAALLKPDALDRIHGLDIEKGDEAIHIRLDENRNWKLTSYYGLPLDTPKLQRLVGQLSDSHILRRLTSNPDKLKALELNQGTIHFLDAEGKMLSSFILGTTLQQGGRAIAFDSKGPAYQADLGGYIDTNPTNWVDKKLIEIPDDKVVGIQFFLENNENWSVRRDNAETEFLSTIPGDLRLPKQPALKSLLQRYRNIRFTSASDTEPVSEQLRQSMDDTRQMRVILDSGESITLCFGKQEITADNADENTPASSKFYAFISSSSADKPINGTMKRLAFEVSSYLFDGIPQNISAVADVPEAPTPEAEAQIKEPPAPAEVTEQPSPSEAATQQKEKATTPSDPAL